MTGGPLFFHISPDGCGEERLAALFNQSGHPAVCHDAGRLAETMLFAKASGGEPLSRWPDAALFAGLYRHVPHWRPPLQAWRHFGWLSGRFPQARFILTLRRPEDWILDRLTRDGGAVLRCHAHHRGCDPADLPGLWTADWHGHLAAVETFFGDDPRLIRVDLDRETPADLAARLGLMPPGSGSQAWFAQGAATQPADRARARCRPAVERVDADDADDIAAFCLRGLGGTGKEDGGLSEYFSAWDGAGRVTDRKGDQRRITVQGGVAVSAPDRHFKLIRAEGVINDVLRLGRAQPLRIDMEDSRWFGSPQGEPLSAPTLCHNRRMGARNAVLWPLPDQHSIGLPGFDDAAPDPIPWEEKLDRVVWRGMISGSVMTGDIKPGPASHVFLRQLADAADDAARQGAWDRLCNTNRLAFVRRWWGHPDFDLGVVMAWGFRALAQDPFLAPYCKPRRDRAFFHRFRYRLCLTGYDHGSNFIGAIDSQSVLLAVDDGWEVFYSGRFQPWKHYVPLERHCADIAEKLAWARDNPQACKAMSAAARAEAALLRKPATRRAILERILDGLAAAG
ncbi:hypothetical protein EYF88_07065 [Paracoccus sediminis]|uniref:Glycosyl transferase family 90 n=1 Tax=Paracoccus sediminis TaxID=1214787 RepID=A0A238W3K7_9RHOB|nr:glycosyl transferase family 90 [Paracoccus sediminis]TBN51541.1 hypothetical protein EYF88_07065 [Paracoccus sediminis]SNR41088.1 Glycosyl transferase family 90 [Paracoccus sediminis]